ncbi:FtsX-like permease family protein [Virgibacillus oceani]|uniref:ABC transporter permease n=1 Tax=Virgibacillus oceani TaxID=1479511 RepID=A0A917HQG9_9BACI|nr:FtsX-like permease family protein [Virgibacillus oceani]GGG87329.1 ABC transporter permease [Virgibacillus oceani]
MTFKQFAFNNVKRNTRQYLSYFLSCMFAVTVFFMYAVIVFHPDIQEAEFRDVVQRGILLSEAIIYIFSFLFVLFSTGSFINSRKKQYGVLTTLGISKSQLNRMLILENTIIGVTSIAAGLLLGALLTKLFLMIFQQILGLDQILPFYLSLKAIGITVILFFIMFEVNSLAVVWTLRTNSIMEVFRGAKGPKKTPKFSWILSLLGIGLIGSGYYLAYTANVMTIIIYMVPILMLVIPGTYFLFTQFSIAFITLLKRKNGFYYNKLNLLTVSELAYKLKDNSRTLFIVAILSAVAFTSSGVLYGLFQGVEDEAKRFVPQDATLNSKGNENADKIEKEIDLVENAFQEKGIAFDSKLIRTTQAQIYSNDKNWDEVWVQIYSYSDYAAITRLHGHSVPFEVDDDEMVISKQEFALPDDEKILPGKLTIKSENNSATFKTNAAKLGLNQNIYTTFDVVVSDTMFKKFFQTAEANEVYSNYAMEIPNWKAHKEDISQIFSHVDRKIAHPDSKAEYYLMMKEGLSYLFFFGIFISVLFFLAAGSILYFRMYQDMDKDLHYYHSLYRIGFTDKEMKKIATRQLGFLFFIPFCVAVVHASFAFKALQNMIASSVIMPSVMIISFFFVIHLINFIFIRNVYTAKLKRVM